MTLAPLSTLDARVLAAVDAPLAFQGGVGAATVEELLAALEDVVAPLEVALDEESRMPSLEL